MAPNRKDILSLVSFLSGAVILLSLLFPSLGPYFFLLPLLHLAYGVLAIACRYKGEDMHVSNLFQIILFYLGHYRLFKILCTKTKTERMLKIER